VEEISLFEKNLKLPDSAFQQQHTLRKRRHAQAVTGSHAPHQRLTSNRTNQVH
jgi:hypothetical protein